MVPHSWIKIQVFSMTLCQIKDVLGRKRLRIDRNRLVAYLVALMEQQSQMRHFKAVYRNDTLGVGYAGFMAGLELVAPLWGELEKRFRLQNSIAFDELTLVDTSLFPDKEEQSITDNDWKKGRVTTRKKPGKKGEKSTTFHICGEKLLAMLNSHGFLAYCKLLPSINSSDCNVFKQPLQWARYGLRKGKMLGDRGFANNEVYKGLEFLRNALADYTLKLISPPRQKQKWALSEEDQLLYKQRWDIEELFRQLKDFFGRFRLSMKGTRKSSIREARVAIATLAWNMERI